MEKTIKLSRIISTLYVDRYQEASSAASPYNMAPLLVTARVIVLKLSRIRIPLWEKYSQQLQKCKQTQINCMRTSVRLNPIQLNVRRTHHVLPTSSMLINASCSRQTLSPQVHLQLLRRKLRSRDDRIRSMYPACAH